MKWIFSLTIILILFSSCKTEFEKIRTSNDPVLVLQKANEYYEEEDYYKAQSLYDIVLPFYRGKSEAQELFLKYAYTHYNQKQYLLANHYFDNYANTFTRSPQREEAQYMAAYSKYQLSPNHKLDQSYSKEAINDFQKFINTYPNSERVTLVTGLIDELRAKMERKAFEQGKLYYQIKNYKAAISSLENMVKDFPETKRGEDIKWIILDSNAILAENSVFAKKEDRLSETLKKAEVFIKKYPQSEYIAQVEKIKNQTITSLNEIQNVRLEK